MRRALAYAVGSALVCAIAFACSVGELDESNKACPCAAGWVCDTAKNVCVRADQLTSSPDGGDIDSGTSGDGAEPCIGEGCPCQTNRECLDPVYNRCVDGKCAECTVTPDTCPANKYCLASFNECAPGCKLDSECVGLGNGLKFCNLQRHQCVACLVDGDCGGGNKKCSPSGACVDACLGNDGGACPTGRTCCAGLCIDTASDVGNCGACGTACTGAQTACCASACVDPLTNPTNCGGCGTVCSNVHATPGCQAGACKPTCNTGYLHCSTGNTGCETNGTNDVAHCGTCTKNCNNVVVHATGISCTNSACNYSACVSPYVDQNGNRQDGCESNGTNCGAKDQPCCQPNNTCNAGLSCQGNKCDD